MNARTLKTFHFTCGISFLNLHLHMSLVYSIVVACCLFMQPNISQSMGLPSGWEKAVVLVEKRCTDLPAVPCANIPPLLTGEPGLVMPDGKSGCAAFCKAPTNTCPVQFLDLCKRPTDYYPIATGFTLHMCDVSILVSNRHVLAESESGSQLFVRGRLKSGEQVRLLIKNVRGHPNKNVDLAISQLLYPRLVKNQDISIGVIPEDAYRKQGKTTLGALRAVHAGDEAVFAGFPSILGVRGLFADKETPLIRSGIVSIVLPGDSRIGDKTFHNIFLMDSWAFKGNSGSPVVIPPSVIGYEGDNRDRKNARIVGVVSAFINLDAPIEQTAIIIGVKAKVNSGLAVVQSLEGIEDMVNQFDGAKCIPIAVTTEK